MSKALPASPLLQTHGKTQAARQLARQDLGVAAFGEVFPGLVLFTSLPYAAGSVVHDIREAAAEAEASQLLDDAAKESPGCQQASKFDQDFGLTGAEG